MPRWRWSSSSLTVPTVSVDVKQHSAGTQTLRAQQLCESRGGRPGLSVPNKPYCFCGRKATVKKKKKTDFRVQELCESRGGRPGLPVPNSPPYGLCGRKAKAKAVQMAVRRRSQSESEK